MNTTDAPTQPLECLDNWIKRTAIMSSSLTAYISAHDPRFFFISDRNNLSDLIEDVTEMQMYMYAAKHYIGLIKTDQISLK